MNSTTMALTAPPDLRYPAVNEADSSSAIEKDALCLVELKKSNPDLRIFTKSTKTYNELVVVWNSDISHVQPLAVCRPTTHAQVAAVVKYVSEHKIPVTIRSGGHDAFGRSRVQDSLVIDLRSLDELSLAADRKTVTIGGGTMALNLYKFLDSYGLMTACSTCGTVGYPNLVMNGGYNLFSGSFGLGVDNIVGATIVTSAGDIKAADPETLWGIRGAGGNFGVVVSLDLKVYERLGVFAGALFYPLDQAREFFTAYSRLLSEDFPVEYSGTTLAGDLPGVGLVFAVLFGWAGETASGKAYLDKILKLPGTPIMNTVAETKWSDVVTASPIKYGVSSTIRSAYVKDLNQDFLACYLNALEKIQKGSGCVTTLHFVHGAGARTNPEACFKQRGDHILIEIICMKETGGDTKDGFAWVQDTFQALKQSPVALKGGYVNLMGLDEPVKESYGPAWEKLVALKQKMDPTNLFKYATPELLQP